MLQKLRDKTSGWIASVILGLLAIPIAFFGIEQYMSRGVETWVARIQAPPTWWEGAPQRFPVTMLWQEQEISAQEFRQAFESARQEERQRQGDAYDPRAFETLESKRAVLEELIDRRVMEMAADRAGITISDAQVKEAIATADFFMVDGKFSPERYQMALVSQRKTATQFENDVRQGLKIDTLPRGLGESAFATKTEVDRILKLLGETRAVSYVQLPPPAPDAGPVAGAEIDAWYKAHRNEYRAPEMVTIEYVEIDGATMPVAPADEATLRQRYEQEKTRLAGQEQRLVSHVLVAMRPDADAATQKAAEAKANKLAADAKVAGADFAALARANSDDTLTKTNGGDLGWVGKDVLPKPVEDAVYAMKAGEVRGPVKSDYGWHVIQVREVKAGEVQTFEQVREQLAREQAEADREQAFNDLSTKVVDLVYKNPTALAPAARDAKLPVKTLGPFARGAGQGIAANPAVQRAAFSESLIQDGTVSDSIEIAPNHIVLLRVTDHVPAREMPVAQVRPQVVAAIRADRAAKAVEAQAEALVAKVRAGTPLEQAAGERQLVAVNVPSVSRGAPMPHPAATEAYFSAPVPAAGKASPGKVRLPDGSFVAFAVTQVVPGDAAKAGLQDRMTRQQQLTQAAAMEDQKAFVEEMRRRMDVDIAEDRL
jgi:peptidyl-prolyl cis-trans isomerase D